MITAEEEAKALEYIQRMDSARAVEDSAADASTVHFMKFDRRVPVHLGKWRLVPPDA